MNAIVYTTNTGHTKAYAELLGQKTGLPVLELKEASKKLPPNAQVIYMGWLMAGTVKGYSKAAQHFSIQAVCGVGMAAVGSQVADIYKTNGICAEIPVFCLQGGFEMEKLRGIYKLMMKTMRATAGKKLSEKTDRTPEEDEMLRLLMHGGNCVSAENLREVVTWYSSDILNKE